MSRRRRNRDRPDFGALQKFAVECPACREHVGVARTLAGRAARCPACDGAFLVPTPVSEEPSLPDPSAGRSRSRRRTAPSIPAFDAPRPSPAPPPATAPEAPPPAPEPPVSAPRPDTDERSIDLPLVFTEPPPPSTRRPLHESPATPSAAHVPESTTAPVAIAATISDDTATSLPDVSPADDASREPPDRSDSGELAFRDPVKTVRSGDAEIELRRLSPEEKRTRRARRSLLILVVGAALLVALAVILGTAGK